MTPLIHLTNLLVLSLLISAGAAPVQSDDAAAIYEQGIGFQSGKSADPIAARQAFEKAASQGHARAAVQLGIMHANASGVPKDDARALEYFNQAAAAGQREGIYNKGLFLLQGRGAPRDVDAGVAALTAAAELGSIPAHVRLADAFYFGSEGLAADRARALPHVKAAADAGDAWACNLFGTMAEFGYAMPVDRHAALHWFTEAARKNNAKAQYNLGRLLHTGKSARSDTVAAYTWLKLASLHGETAAAYILKDHVLSMTPAQIVEGDRAVEEFNGKFSGKDAKNDPAASQGGG